jgi:hypothetical protein
VKGVKMKAWILEKQAKIEEKPLRLVEVPTSRKYPWIPSFVVALSNSRAHSLPLSVCKFSTGWLM